MDGTFVAFASYGIAAAISFLTAALMTLIVKAMSIVSAKK